VVMPNAAAFGLTNTTDAVYTGPSLNLLPSTPQMEFSVHKPDGDHIFWDLVHPSTKTHALIAEYVRRNVLEPNFENVARLSPCSYVEIDNQFGAPLLLTAEDTEACGFGGWGFVLAGHRRLLSLPPRAELTISTLLGKTAAVTAEAQTAAFSTKHASAPLRVQLPVMQRVQCKEGGGGVACAAPAAPR